MTYLGLVDIAPIFIDTLTTQQMEIAEIKDKSIMRKRNDVKMQHIRLFSSLSRSSKFLEQQEYSTVKARRNTYGSYQSLPWRYFTREL
jgi:FtsZ-binding cell division protein ZapB